MNYHIHKYSRHDRRSPAVAVGEKVRAEKAVLAFIKTFSVLISRHFVGIYIEGGVRRDWSRCSPGEGTGRVGVGGLALPPSHCCPPGETSEVLCPLAVCPAVSPGWGWWEVSGPSSTPEMVSVWLVRARLVDLHAEWAPVTAITPGQARENTEHYFHDTIFFPINIWLITLPTKHLKREKLFFGCKIFIGHPGPFKLLKLKTKHGISQSEVAGSDNKAFNCYDSN